MFPGHGLESLIDTNTSTIAVLKRAEEEAARSPHLREISGRRKTDRSGKTTECGILVVDASFVELLACFGIV